RTRCALHRHTLCGQGSNPVRLTSAHPMRSRLEPGAPYIGTPYAVKARTLHRVRRGTKRTCNLGLFLIRFVFVVVVAVLAIAVTVRRGAAFDGVEHHAFHRDAVLLEAALGYFQFFYRVEAKAGHQHRDA